MRRAALACVVAAGCGGSSHWIGYACELSIAPGRDAIAFVDTDGKRLVLRRDDGDKRLAFPACTGDGKHIQGIVALADGWRALVYGYSVSGGNWHASGDMDDVFACIVDFRTGSTNEVSPDALSHDLRHFDATVGATTGWIYNHEIVAPVTAIDLANGKTAVLEGAGKAIVETGTTARTVATDLVQTDPEHPIYKATLIVQDYDTTVWPPAPREPRRIPVGGRADNVIVSADGRWAAYDGSPYYVGIESEGEVADVGLVDLETGVVAFEQLRAPGDARVGDIASAGDRAWVLVAARGDRFAQERRYTMRWLDKAGAQVGAAQTLRSDFPPTLTWLATRGRVVSEDSCDADLLDLPPPVK